ncbi:hypothetical protein [Pleurocapsa sp. PCC 7319]|uniref:hypothetical protein n=1 Tax=Pleurocapsa sp. PCC 7319 TaxID=118161 RepID=UPI000345871B|nr:hypothetical protein [Pleurocapsa sp. PCC 7319]
MNPIVVFQEHGEILAYWCERRYLKETVICFDRHLDLKKIPSQQVLRLLAVKNDPLAIRSLNRDIPFRDDDMFAYGLDNFVYAAITLNYINRFIWVVPELHSISTRDLAIILWDQLSLIPDHGNEIIETFCRSSFSAKANIKNVSIEITTLSRLPYITNISNSHIDIDLDFFCNPIGDLEHTAEDLVQTLVKMGVHRQVESITYSISSGFLPSQYRYLADAITNLLDRNIDLRSIGRKHASRSLGIIATGKNIEDQILDELWTDELRILGASGWSLRALLEARMGKLSASTSSYYTARLAGDRATWAAYVIGMEFLKRGDYATAESWFQEASIEIIDTIQSHALIMHTLCLCRSRKMEIALKRARVCFLRIPMCIQAYKLGAIAAESLCVKDCSDWCQAQIKNLKLISQQ